MNAEPFQDDEIVIDELEVHFRVGVPDEERALPQRLLITVGLFSDLRAAAARDDLNATIDYHAVAQRIARLGDHKSWKLIETLAEDVAALALSEFRPRAVEVEVKKFILSETRCVSVRIRREA